MDWIDITKQRPTEADTFEGRVAAIDEDGYAVIAMLLPNGNLLAMGGLAVTHWLPLPARKERAAKPVCEFCGNPTGGPSPCCNEGAL